MLFSEVLGQEHITNHLTTSVDNGRIARAKLCVGTKGF
jgi:DNA polymerase-3 subunit delta'